MKHAFFVEGSTSLRVDLENCSEQYEDGSTRYRESSRFKILSIWNGVSLSNPMDTEIYKLIDQTLHSQNKAIEISAQYFRSDWPGAGGWELNKVSTGEGSLNKKSFGTEAKY